MAVPNPQPPPDGGEPPSQPDREPAQDSPQTSDSAHNSAEASDDAERTEPPEAESAAAQPTADEPSRTESLGKGTETPAAAQDVDARWAEIVAELEAEGWSPPAPESTRPASSEVSEPARRPLGPRDWPTTPEVEALEEAETHFTPPDPPPVLGRDPMINVAWAFVIAVPILFVVAFTFVQPFPGILALIGLPVFLAGLAVLVWRMPHRRDDDDHDDGAVV